MIQANTVITGDSLTVLRDMRPSSSQPRDATSSRENGRTT